MDRLVECARVSEGLMREMMRFEVMPDSILTFATHGPNPIMDVSRSVTSDSAFDNASYDVKALNPKVSLTADEPLYLPEMKINVTTRDVGLALAIRIYISVT